VVSVLGYWWAAKPRSSPGLCSFVFFNNVYNGYGDHNISLTLKFLRFFVFFLLLLTFQKGRSAVGFSTRKTENTPVFYNILHITNAVWNTSDYGDRLAGFRMVLVVNATKAKKFPAR
jgi:hypothetical protein